MAANSFKKFALRWGFALLVMGLIFAFSALPMKSTPPSTAPFKLTWDFLFRKGGHVLGYALLALALRRGLRLRGWKGAAAVLACVLLFALSDEFHQSFVPGRDARLMDVGIDLLGAALGVWVAAKFTAIT